MTRIFIECGVFKEQKKEDVVFECRNGSVCMSKKILALISPNYFFKLLYLNNPSISNETNQIKLDYSTYDVETVKIMKTFLHTRVFPVFEDMSLSTIDELGQLSKKMKEKFLQMVCDQKRSQRDPR